MNLDDFGAAIYNDEAVGLTGGKGQVAFADTVMKRGALIIDTGFRLADALIPLLRAREAGVQVDVDQHGYIGLQALAGDPVEFEDSIRRETATAALIDERGVRKAVAQDSRAGFEGGADHLFHVLRPAGEVQQQFGARVNLGVDRVEQDAADLLADVGAARFYGFDNRPAAAAKRPGEQTKLRGLAAPVNAFKRDKSTAWFQNFNFRKCFSAASARFGRAPGTQAPRLPMVWLRNGVLGDGTDGVPGGGPRRRTRATCAA
jgi:hypothetical protein